MRLLPRRSLENIRRTVADDTCWLVTTGDGRTIGTITVEYTADPYWLPTDDPDDALYIHRMVVDDGTGGRARLRATRLGREVGQERWANLAKA